MPVMLRAGSCHHVCSCRSHAWASAGQAHPIRGTWQLPEPPGKLPSHCPGSAVPLEKLGARWLRAGRAPAAPGSALRREQARSLAGSSKKIHTW